MTAKDSVAFKSGGDRSHAVKRYDLIPREFLDCLADRLALGLVQHGDREILRLFRDATPEAKAAILADEPWWTEMINHLQDHVISLREEDFFEDDAWGHIGAIMWNAGMMAWRLIKQYDAQFAVAANQPGTPIDHCPHYFYADTGPVARCRKLRGHEGDHDFEMDATEIEEPR